MCIYKGQILAYSAPLCAVLYVHGPYRSQSFDVSTQMSRLKPLTCLSGSWLSDLLHALSTLMSDA